MSGKYPRVDVISSSCSVAQRPLNCRTDSVSICGRDAEGNIQNIRTDNTGRLDVTATNLDIRNLSCGLDNVSICGRDAQGNIQNIRTDNTGRLDVTATNLDIRNLSCGLDNITTCGLGVDGANHFLQTDNFGNVSTLPNSSAYSQIGRLFSVGFTPNLNQVQTVFL